MFVVFSLPRSRSTWLSVFLGREKPVGHDIYIGCSHPDEFASKLECLAGTCETGAGFAAPLIRKRFPDCKFAVIVRDPSEVAASLAKFGITGQEAELERRIGDLADIAKDPDVLAVNFSDLDKLETCRSLYEHCLGRPLDAAWWAQIATLNIQVDMALEFARIQGATHQRDALKREVQRQLAKPGLQIEEEPWSARAWEEAEALAEVHFCETAGGVEPNRRFKMDRRLMALMHQQGALKIVTARQDGELVGYLTWQLGPDVESEGLLKADQGGWFVLPGYPRALVKMFDRSVELLRIAGVKVIYPHHPMQGRGARLGTFFERRGAKPMQTTYSLWIGRD